MSCEHHGSPITGCWLANERHYISRREVLTVLGVGAVAAALPGCRPSSPAASVGPDLEEPLYYSSVQALAQAIRVKQISSREVVQACLDRIESDRENNDSAATQKRDRKVLRRRRDPQAKAAGKAKRGKETYEAGRHC